MKTEEIKSIKIELEGTEADQFKSAIKKINNENGRIGFSIRDINDKINPK